MTEPQLGRHAGDHSLTQGLKGDATYLVVNDRGALENFGINGAPARSYMESSIGLPVDIAGW